MIGILFATQKEAQSFLDKGVPHDVLVEVSEKMGADSARVATLNLIDKGATTIINAGVCGALSDDIERGGVFFVSEVFNEEDQSFILSKKKDVLLPAKRLVTVEKAVFQLERKKGLSNIAELVDMEGYAVAKICRDKKIPCIMFKGVTDFGDDDGKNDIQKYIVEVSERVANAIVQYLEKRHLKTASSWKKFFSFTKVEHTILSLPLLFAGAWIGAEGIPPIRALCLISLVGLGARTFGMAMNRILDKNMDEKNPRTKDRELPSGKLSLAQGYSVATMGLLVYFIGCFLLGTTVLKLSLIPLVPLSLYSVLKRFTPLCHYGIGICLATAPLGAFVAVTNKLSFNLEIGLLVLFAFCWISGFDIIYALLDMESDRMNGVRSIPAEAGEFWAQVVAAGTHLIAMIALFFLVSGWLSSLAATVSLLAFIAAYLQPIPPHVRFFPISAIAGIAGACVVLLGG